MVRARSPSRSYTQPCRRSSGVEHTLGKGGADSSILSGGTIYASKINN